MSVSFLKIVFFLIACNAICYPQLRKFVVIDDETNMPVAYSSIKYNDGEGLYSDENGIFYLTHTVNKVEISHFSYKDTNFNLPQYKDTLRLSPKVIELKEVIIVADKQKGKEISFGDFSRRTHFMWFCSPKTEFIVFMKPDEKVKGSSIRNIMIPFVSDTRFEDLKADTFVYRLNIYNADKEKILSETLAMTKDQIDKDGVFYRPEYELIFPDSGLYFGIELIGWNVNNKFIDNSYFNKGRHPVSLRFSKTKVFNSYYRNPFKGEGKWQIIDERVEDFQLEFNKPIGLSLGLTLKEGT